MRKKDQFQMILRAGMVACGRSCSEMDVADCIDLSFPPLQSLGYDEGLLFNGLWPSDGGKDAV